MDSLDDGDIATGVSAKQSPVNMVLNCLSIYAEEYFNNRIQITSDLRQ